MTDRPVDTQLAARVEERDHLLRSLEDLDAEYAAGDIDEHDYRALRADYTTRAASTIRAVERRAAAVPPGRSWGRIALWTTGIVVLAALAGVWVADSSGSRRAGDSITGDIRDTVRSRLFDAQEAMGDQDFAGAIEIYDDVLADEPSNAEALTYRGWLTHLDGDSDGGRDFVEEAVAADPDYPDARVFATALALETGAPLEAAAHLRALDRIPGPPFIQQLVSAQGLRDRVALEAGAAAAELVVPLLTGPDAVGFTASGLTVDVVTLAAEHLAANDRLDAGLALYEPMLAEAADDPDVTVSLGWFLGRASVGLPEGLETARGYLTEVIEDDPARPDALVYRAFVLAELGDLPGARADLAAYESLEVIRHDLDALLGSWGLRSALDEAGP